MVGVSRHQARLHAGYALTWLFGSLIVAGALTAIGVGLFRCLVPVFSENLFYPAVIVLEPLLLIATRKHQILFSFYAGAVAEGVLANIFWSGCQMGDWRWFIPAGIVMLTLGWLVRRAWCGILEMKTGAATIWLCAAYFTWALINPLFSH